VQILCPCLEANYDRELTAHQGTHGDLCSFHPGSPFSHGFTYTNRSRALGYKDVSTTIIYTHVLNNPGITVKSPLDDTSPGEVLPDK
jgi:hypothetical protein